MLLWVKVGVRLKMNKTFCLRCNDNKFITVWKDLTEKEKITVSCPMCTEQRPPLELNQSLCHASVES
jgi:transcription elongation factor Elf1